MPPVRPAPAPCPACHAVNVYRQPSVYVDGRSVYVCRSCNATMIDMDECPTTKALIPLTYARRATFGHG